jgi:hypothetical protein
MVGMQGFEPWTSRSRSVRATKLRYIPISNSQNLIYNIEACKSSPLLEKNRLVGMQGFEPWTSRSQGERATKLRYIPMRNSASFDQSQVLAYHKYFSRSTNKYPLGRLPFPRGLAQRLLAWYPFY